MIGYKLFHKRKDGTYGPLFINKKQKLVAGVYYAAGDYPLRVTPIVPAGTFARHQWPSSSYQPS